MYSYHSWSSIASLRVLDIYIRDQLILLYIIFYIIMLFFLQIWQSYYWKSMTKDVAEFCKKCETCQQVNNRFDKQRPQLHPIPVSDVWKRIWIDLIGPLPEIQRGNKYINIATDYFSKWLEATALPRQDCSRSSWLPHCPVLPSWMARDSAVRPETRICERGVQDFVWAPRCRASYQQCLPSPDQWIGWKDKSDSCSGCHQAHLNSPGALGSLHWQRLIFISNFEARFLQVQPFYPAVQLPSKEGN